MAKVHTWQGTPHLVFQFHCLGCECDHIIPVEIREPIAGERTDHAWDWNGDVDRPTITPSLLVNVGGGNPTVPICHSFVKEGKMEFLSDCTHSLAGQTVDLPEYQK